MSPGRHPNATFTLKVRHPYCAAPAAKRRTTASRPGSTSAGQANIPRLARRVSKAAGLHPDICSAMAPAAVWTLLLAVALCGTGGRAEPNVTDGCTPDEATCATAAAFAQKFIRLDCEYEVPPLRALLRLPCAQPAPGHAHCTGMRCCYAHVFITSFGASSLRGTPMPHCCPLRASLCHGPRTRAHTRCGCPVGRPGSMHACDCPPAPHRLTRRLAHFTPD